MLDIISMITLIIVFSSFGTFMMLIIIGGNMNKSDKEIKDEEEAQLLAIREYNEKHKNRKSLLTKIKEFIKKLFVKGKD